MTRADRMAAALEARGERLEAELCDHDPTPGAIAEACSSRPGPLAPCSAS